MFLRRFCVLLLSLFSRAAASDAPVEMAPELRVVTCASALKLQHSQTKSRLHSHEIAYGSGSGQQSVTGFPEGDDSNSLWIVRGEIDGAKNVKQCQRGTRIRNGATIRLQHLGTGHWLHSHGHRSPLSSNQEVSAYGNADESNTNDNWRVETNGEEFWERNKKVRLVHADTGVFLWSHNKAFPRPISGQLEVCGVNRKAPEADWVAAEGVYFSE